MARKDRTGNRKGREQNRKVKVPELGYYLIVTDTEGTERCFFQGLQNDLPTDIRNKIFIIGYYNNGTSECFYVTTNEICDYIRNDGYNDLNCWVGNAVRRYR